MIIVKVIGGLGNQMFQIAFALAISMESNEEIFVDISSYRKYKIREFSLSHLNIASSINISDALPLSKFQKQKYILFQKSYHIYQKVMKSLTNIDKYGEFPYRVLAKKGLLYNFDRYYYPTIELTNKTKNIYGYFQSEKYFEKYKHSIIQQLKVNTKVTESERHLLNEIQSCNAVGISIRIGDDYLRSKSLNVCDENYYYNAVNHIMSKVDNPQLYIFSDSIDKVKKTFKFDHKVNYIDGYKDYQSLRLLYNCKHFVIANSSFSWWGSYLSENPEKIIVAPKKWYTDTKINPDIYHDNMILI